MLYLFIEENVLYTVVGSIARFCPKTKNLESLSDSIYIKLLIELNDQVNKLPNVLQNSFSKFVNNKFYDFNNNVSVSTIWNITTRIYKDIFRLLVGYDGKFQTL